MRSRLNFTSLLFCFLIAVLFVACDKKKAENIDTNTAVETVKKVSTEVVENPTEITFSKDLNDFGDMNQGDVVSTEFKFTNTGDHDLIISSARGTCGCTVPDWPKEPIKPGDSDVIKVEFNSKNKSGPFNKTVTVTANTVPSDSKLSIKGNVIVPKDK